MDDRVARVREHMDTVKRLMALADADTLQKLSQLLRDMELYVCEIESSRQSER